MEQKGIYVSGTKDKEMTSSSCLLLTPGHKTPGILFKCCQNNFAEVRAGTAKGCFFDSLSKA